MALAKWIAASGDENAILNVEKALRISGGVRGVELSDAMMVSSLRENLCSSPISK